MTQVVRTDAAPMTEPPRSVDRISRRQVDKFAERRAQLAESALLTLSELGYARTSLREIAQNSEFSHGVLHYYFRDKVDLITHCVREYKARCVTRYDQIAATATTADELRVGFAAGLGADHGRRTPTCTASGTTCAARACSRRRSATTSRPSTRAWSG